MLSTILLWYWPKDLEILNFYLIVLPFCPAYKLLINTFCLSNSPNRSKTSDMLDFGLKPDPYNVVLFLFHYEPRSLVCSYLLHQRRPDHVHLYLLRYSANNDTVRYSYSNLLPLRFILENRIEKFVVDQKIFISWYKLFVGFARPWTVGGRKGLLFYDSYRYHMPFTALNILKQRNREYLTTTAHTSSAEELPDVIVLYSYKQKIKKLLFYSPLSNLKCNKIIVLYFFMYAVLNTRISSKLLK